MDAPVSSSYFNKVVWWSISKDIASCLALGAHSVLTKTLFDQTLVRLPWVHFSTQPRPWTPSCLQPAKLSFSKNHAKSARIPLFLMSPLRTFYSLNPSPHPAPWLYVSPYFSCIWSWAWSFFPIAIVLNKSLPHHFSQVSESFLFKSTCQWLLPLSFLPSRDQVVVEFFYLVPS